MDDQFVLAAAPLVAIGGLLALLGFLDLSRREPKDVNGSRIIWGIALLAIPLGPVAYLWFGRRRPNSG
jgi:hypothetical protein